MAIALQGTPVTTAQTASATTAVFNLPASIQAGEFLAVFYMTDETGKTLSASGWTNNSVNLNTSNEVEGGILWKQASGSEGATETFTYSVGSGNAWAVAARFSGVDTSDPFDGGNRNSGVEPSEDPFTLAANSITNVGADNWILLMWGDQANRSLTTLDAQLNSIGNVNGSATTGYCLFAAYDTGQTANPAYSNNMSDARDWGWVIYELKASGGGFTPVSGNSIQFLNLLGVGT